MIGMNFVHYKQSRTFNILIVINLMIRLFYKCTYYSKLQLKPSASLKQIKLNYLRLAKIYHPDVYKGKLKNRFNQIMEAYQTLKDPSKKKSYDEKIGLNQENTQIPNENKHQKKQEFFYEFATVKLQDIQKEYQELMKQPIKTQFKQIYMAETPMFREATMQERSRGVFVTQKNSERVKDDGLESEYKQIYDEQMKIINMQVKHKQEEVQRFNKVQRLLTDQKKMKLIIAVCMASVSSLLVWLYSRVQSNLQSQTLKQQDAMRQKIKLQQIQQRKQFQKHAVY